MTSCTAVQVHLTEYLSHRLHNKERQVVVNHLIDCASCQQALKDVKSLQELVHQAYPEIEPSAQFSQRVMFSIEDILDSEQTASTILEAVEAETARQISSSPLERWPGLAWGAFGLLLISFGLWGTLGKTTPESEMFPTVALQDDQRVESVLQVEEPLIPSDERRLTQAQDSHIDPEIEASGFKYRQEVLSLPALHDEAFEQELADWAARDLDIFDGLPPPFKNPDRDQPAEPKVRTIASDLPVPPTPFPPMVISDYEPDDGSPDFVKMLLKNPRHRLLALGSLAVQMHVLAGGPPALNKAADGFNGHLIEHQHESTGLIGPAQGPYMLNHAMATLSLLLAYQKNPNPELKKVLEKALVFISESQNPEGGWGQGSLLLHRQVLNPSNTIITGWQVLTLRMAERNNLRVSKKSLRAVTRWFESMTDDRDGRVGFAVRGDYSHGVETPTAIALLVNSLAVRDPRKIPQTVSVFDRVILQQMDSGYGLKDHEFWFFALTAYGLQSSEVSEGFRTRQILMSELKKAPTWRKWGSHRGPNWHKAMDMLVQALARDPQLFFPKN